MTIAVPFSVVTHSCFVGGIYIYTSSCNISREFEDIREPCVEFLG